MQTEISYRGDNTDHRALLNLVQWFGYRKSMLIFRELRNAKRYLDAHPTWDPNQFLNTTCFAIEMGGVSGHPVRRLFAKFFGEDVLAAWIAS